MGWSIGYDSHWNRDIGYGVPSVCDHPGCSEGIDRGLAYVCGGQPYGEPDGCGLYFCESHLFFGAGPQVCERCFNAEGGNRDAELFDATPDTNEWVQHKLTDESWSEWRADNVDWVNARATGEG